MPEQTMIQDALAGALGGALGTLAMEQTGTVLYGLETEDKKRREEELRAEPPYQVMAAKAARVAGREFSEEQKKKAGMVLHSAYGLGWGVLYGVLRRRYRPLAFAAGLPFAVLFFAIGDEGVNWALGTTPPPQKFPWEAHARGLAAHIAFTAVAEVVCRGLEA